MSVIDGDYTLTAPDGEILAALLNPDFGFSETNEFCASGMCMLEAEINTLNDSGNEDGAILIDAFNGTGALQYSIDGGNSYQDSNVFENLEAGEYIVVVTDANGCDFLVEVEVMLGTATLTEELGYQMEVYPNPTKGVFRVDISGLQSIYYLELDILDIRGNLVQRSTMHRYNETLTGVFSLEAFPAGSYFIRFRNSEIQRLIKVVKQ